MGVRGLGLILTAALALVACSGDAASPPDVEGAGVAENPQLPVQAILRDRAERLRAGDVEGYLAGLSPAARAFEEPIARSAVTLPLDDIDLTIGEATISDDGTRIRNAAVTLLYTFKELPRDNPFRLPLVYDIERQEGGFVVTRSAYRAGAPLWASGPVQITRTPHFLVMSRPGTPRVAEAAGQAEEGLARLLPKLTLESDDRYLLVMASNDEQYVALGGGEDSLALASVAYVATAGHPARPEERHMVANLPKVFQRSEVKLEKSASLLPASVVFQHELAHLALSRFTRGCTDPWVVEGAAMLLAGERRMPEWEARTSEGRLDASGLHPVGPEPVDYAFANAAVLYLVEAHGPEKFFDFYQNFKTLPEQGCSGQVGNVRSRLDERLLRRYYRLTVEDLEGFTREYIRKAVAAP